MDYHNKYIKYKNKYLGLKLGNEENNICKDNYDDKINLKRRFPKTNKILKLYKPKIILLNDHGVDGTYQKWKEENSIVSPYCLSFKDNTKILNFIGAKHTIDKTSDTFKLIKKIIKQYKPQLIIVEGVPHSMGMNPVLKHFQGEGMYAINLGKQYGADFIGIEEEERKLIQKLLKKYSREDILGYDFLRMHNFDYKIMKKSKKKFLNDFRTHNMFNDATYDPIKWFENTFGKKFKYGQFLEYSFPYNGMNAVITQKIGYEYSKNRDVASIKILYKLINQYDNILYIVGENHIYAIKDILVHSFGNYKIISNMVSKSIICKIADMISKYKLIGIGEFSHGIQESWEFRFDLLKYVIQNTNKNIIIFNEMSDWQAKNIMNDTIWSRKYNKFINYEGIKIETPVDNGSDQPTWGIC